MDKRVEGTVREGVMVGIEIVELASKSLYIYSASIIPVDLRPDLQV